MAVKTAQEITFTVTAVVDVKQWDDAIPSAEQLEEFLPVHFLTDETKFEVTGVKDVTWE